MTRSPARLLRRAVMAVALSTVAISTAFAQAMVNETRDPNQHNASTLSTHERCLMHRLAALRRRGDDHGVHAAATRETLRRNDGILSR